MKKAVEGVLHVTVISAKLHGSNNGSEIHSVNHSLERTLDTFVEIESGEVSRRTAVRRGMEPKWEERFNMMLHGKAESLKFHLYQWKENGVKFDYLASCEIKVTSHFYFMHFCFLKN